jgi:hypothetical protein
VVLAFGNFFIFFVVERITSESTDEL